MSYYTPPAPTTPAQSHPPAPQGDRDAPPAPAAHDAQTQRRVPDAPALYSDRDASPLDARSPEADDGGLPSNSRTPDNRPLISLCDVTTITQNHHRSHSWTGAHAIDLATARRIVRSESSFSALQQLSTQLTESPPDDLSLSYPEILEEPMEPLLHNDYHLDNLHAVTTDLRARETSDSNVLSALQFMLHPAQLSQTFPLKFEQTEPPVGSFAVSRWKIQSEYAMHLVCVIDLTTCALNDYLEAANSSRTFSFGSTSLYKGRSFIELIHSDWATKQVAMSIEQHVLRRLRSAYLAIEHFQECTDFVPSRGYPRVVSPTLTNSSKFTDSVMGAVERDSPQLIPLPVMSPYQEDDQFDLELASQLSEVIAPLQPSVIKQEPEAAHPQEVEQTEVFATYAPATSSRPRPTALGLNFSLLIQLSFLSRGARTHVRRLLKNDPHV
jgi:hypothetical protein